MMKIMRSFAPIALALALSIGLLAGCGAAKKPENSRDEPLTIMMGSIQSVSYTHLFTALWSGKFIQSVSPT